MDSVTLEDVAKAAGVSPSTVSRVLNGTARVSSKKQLAVHEVVRRLGYRPNAMAQSLARGQSLSVGVLSQELSSPYYAEIGRGIERSLQNTPYQPVFISGHWRADTERDALEVLLRQRVDGLVVLGGFLPDEELLKLSQTRPFLVVARNIPRMEANCLKIDSVYGGYLGTKHLIELGHRRIVHISGPLNHEDAIDRQQGYRRALGEAKIPLDERLEIEGNYQESSGLMAVQSLLTRGITFSAIFAANDQTASGARLALHRHGIRVPDDVSLVGFDDIPASLYMVPPLTTVRQPTFEMGRNVGELMLQMIQDPQTQPRFSEHKVQLVLRESTAKLRG